MGPQGEAPLSGKLYGRFGDGVFLPVAMFLLSLCSGGVGFWFICVMPIGSGFDLLCGTILLALFLFGFFHNVPSFLVAVFFFPPLWGKYWMLSVLGTSLLLFGLLYAVYYAAARISSHGKSDVRLGTISFPG